MKSITTELESLFEKTEEYGRTTVELMKLNATETFTDAVTTFVLQLITFSVALLFAFFLNVGIALWIGVLLGAMYYGFFVVAAFYALLAVLLRYFGSSWIKRPLTNSLITHILTPKAA
jgi:membrane protein implicated in regulation of membrane protease activity